jgi:hypothetical protein
VWESEAAATAGMENPVFRDALAKAEMPRVEPRIYPLHNYFITSELPTRVS